MALSERQKRAIKNSDKMNGPNTMFDSFVSNHCEFGQSLSIAKRNLFSAYTLYAGYANELTKREFNERMLRKFSCVTNSTDLHREKFIGIALKQDFWDKVK